MDDYRPLSDRLSEIGTEAARLSVKLSYELVHLLSEQLYQSPLKAIEELIVNSYDADAPSCKVWVPENGDLYRFIAVYDDGVGMDAAGLQDLWHIGRSSKRAETIEKIRKRKQIGKFGIGKLATYSVAEKITYLSQSNKRLLGVTVGYDEFQPDPEGGGQVVTESIRALPQSTLQDDPTLKVALEKLGLDAESLSGKSSWTLVLLEKLKPRASSLSIPRLRYVLSTAMPIAPRFTLVLNGSRIESYKSELERLFSFEVKDLPRKRLDNLKKTTGIDWTVSGDGLVSEAFPSGVTGTVEVTKKSLKAGKSSDLGRSHGFFVRVRGRLVAEEDPLFGLHPLSHEVWNRFRAEIYADDLDSVVKAPREGVEESDLKIGIKTLLNELFNEARDRFQRMEEDSVDADKRKTEEERSYVPPSLVEYPVADVLGNRATRNLGAEADETWFYLDIEDGENIDDLVQKLYQTTRDKYHFSYAELPRNERMVKFSPGSATFLVNTSHDFVRAHESGTARYLLEDVIVAEALLEVYLREQDVSPHTVGQILEKRDKLLRNLANERLYSLDALSAALVESKGDERDLEMALIGAARALGFVATHISGSDEPDGIARFGTTTANERKIILEAKSSTGVPSLQTLDLAGIHQHMLDYKAHGVLLVAPSYPGETRGEGSQLARRATELKISCWNVDQLAKVVKSAEARHITAETILNIVFNAFSPEQVAQAVERLFEEPTWDRRQLYVAIIEAIRSLEDRLPDADRTVGMIATEVSRDAQFRSIKSEDVSGAIRDMAGSSQGLLVIRDDKLRLQGSVEELERRLSRITNSSGNPRRRGGFRKE